jgi:hypothetical protein
MLRYIIALRTFVPHFFHRQDRSCLIIDDDDRVDCFRQSKQFSNCRRFSMKNVIVGCLVALGLMSSPASAEIANLTGHYVCVKNCNGTLWHSTYVTQNGWDLNLLTGANEPLRAQTDWFSPNRIWIAAWNTGAVYSPNGWVIQFDNGMIWRRDCNYYNHDYHCDHAY